MSKRCALVLNPQEDEILSKNGGRKCTNVRILQLHGLSRFKRVRTILYETIPFIFESCQEYESCFNPNKMYLLLWNHGIFYISNRNRYPFIIW
ncbi:hypothetical protein DERF_011579 [Dermatophagoides farinae]|uniref:Uncharacterized protein n=1 Tax=Dermatophagoides farinae TaxID=6954 RepID=A0A922HXF1_DERFA|nr:hypothetical protein DERF_011579 [Dermatophagoides farinae]